MASYAAALSEHPLATQAVGEAVGQLLDEVGPAPDLAMLFVTVPHAGALEDISRAVRSLLNPRVLMGSSAVSVVGGAREVEDGPGIALWAGRFGVDLEPVRLEAFRSGDGSILVAGGGVIGQNDGTLLMIADPFSFPTEDILEHLAEVSPGVGIIGGLAPSGRGPGGNTLVLDDERFTDGAVGVWLPPSVAVSPLVSQGCRPIGQAMTVTKSEGTMIRELAGQPALDRLMSLIDSLPAEDRDLAAQGLHIGIVVDEHRHDFGRGDFLIRGVVGADREAGAVAVTDAVEVGTTVQFHVRDAGTAHDDITALLMGRSASSAVVFTGAERGSHLLGDFDHDAAVLSAALGGRPIAGMFSSGEIGPIRGRNALHGAAASVALFP